MNGRIHPPHGYKTQNLPPDPSNLQSISSSKRRLVAIAALLGFLSFTATVLSWSRLPLNDVAEDYLDDSDASKNKTKKTRQSVIADRHNCQIIYVLGVEGAVHHGFTPVLEKLARHQIDPATGTPFEISYPNGRLRAGLFGHHGEARPLEDESLIRQTLRQICPRDGKKHVIIEDTSFPSGLEDDIRTYRIHRQPWWSESTMEEIAMSDTALNHPTNLHIFHKAYSPHADIKFIVLHRSFVETIASHYDFDGTVEKHSNVVRGFLLLLRRFLDSHTTDQLTGEKLWTFVCVERFMTKTHLGSDEQMDSARQNIIRYIADFLGWSQDECPNCFSQWKESSKDHLELLGADGMAILLKHMKQMAGVWPPVVENALPDQKCSL